MPLSREQFTRGLYEECLEEAGFLYEQRQTLLARGDLTRVELGRLEQRLEAFIEALVEGGDAAITFCLERAPEGDAGEAYATVRLLSRLGRTEPLAALLGELPEDAPEQAIALRDGLCHEMPEGLLPSLEQLPAALSSEATGILATALGHRRREGGDWLLARLRHSLARGSLQGTTAYAWALGRLRPPGTEEVLSRCLDVGNPELRLAATLALLRLGNSRAVRSLLAPRSFPAWACLPMGLCGGPAVLPRLKAFASREENASEALLALGLLGDLSAVPELLAHLEHPACADVASEALELLTGAGLVEPVEEPEEQEDEDEPFEDERMAPPRKIESASGPTRVRPSRRATEWHRWWEEHRSQLPSGRFLRSGELCTPERLLAAPGAGVGGGLLRQLLADELVIRYGLDVGFEPDALLSAQGRALNQGQLQLAQRRNGFTQGRWYLAGALSS